MSGWSRRLRFRETTIQRVWRGQRIRRHLTVRNKTETVAATRLQSVWRGHIVWQQQGKNYVATNTAKGPNNKDKRQGGRRHQWHEWRRVFLSSCDSDPWLWSI
eukprot:PhF_6_TR40380/c1_g7_i2/m.60139